MSEVQELEIGEGILISNRRCLFDTRTGTLVLADLHLGMEGAARDDGVYFPKVQKEEVRRELEAVLDTFKVSRIVIDGDLKHTFDRNLEQEWHEIKEIFGLLMNRVDDVHLVRGNHDNFIAGILPKGTDTPLLFEDENLQVVHGHKAEALGEDGRDRAKTLVLAHEHPSVLLRDRIGAAVRLPCFLHHPKEGIVVLPAFSTLTKGSDVLSRGFMSKLLRDMEPGEFMAYAVSEIGLLGIGRLGDLVP